MSHTHEGCPDVDVLIADVEEFIGERMKDGLTVAELVDIGGQVCSLVGCLTKKFRSDDLAEFDKFAAGVKRVWAAKVTPIDLPLNDYVEGAIVDPFLESQVVPTLHLARRALAG